MKKTTAVLLALLVAMAALSATVCAAEIDLIPADADWVMTEAGGSSASWSYGENGLTVKDNGAGWPNIAYSLETPVTVEVENATLRYKISNVNTAGNLAILITLSDTQVIVPHRLFTDDSVDFETGVGYDSGSGDIMNGSYEGEISLAELKVADGIGLKDYTPADGKITITAVTLYATGGAEYTVNELVIDDGSTADESSEAPAVSEEPAGIFRRTGGFFRSPRLVFGRNAFYRRHGSCRSADRGRTFSRRRARIEKAPQLNQKKPPECEYALRRFYTISLKPIQTHEREP